MSQPVILMGKTITAGLWVSVLLAALGLVPDPFRVVLLGFGALVLAVHVLEVCYLFARHKSRVRSSMDVVSVLVFGVFTLTPLIS